MNLSAELKIHNVFHVSKLREHKEMNEMKSEAYHSIRNVSKDDREYAVRELTDLKKRDRQL